MYQLFITVRKMFPCFWDVHFESYQNIFYSILVFVYLLWSKSIWPLKCFNIWLVHIFQCICILLSAEFINENLVKKLKSTDLTHLSKHKPSIDFSATCFSSFNSVSSSSATCSISLLTQLREIECQWRENWIRPDSIKDFTIHCFFQM